MFRFCCLLTTLQLAVSLVSAAVFTVGPAGAHADVQAAVDAALVAGGDNEIRVQEGTFVGPVAVPAQDLTGDLVVTGGWNDVFDDQTEDSSATVLSGGMANRVIDISGTGAGSLISIQNLTIRDGFDLFRGAGIQVDCQQCQVELTDLGITENLVGNDENFQMQGSAIRASLQGDSHLIVDSCEINSNRTEGANNADSTVFVCTHGTSTLTIRDTSIHDNLIESQERSAGGGAIGIFPEDNSRLTLTGNTFENNTVNSGGSTTSGGGIEVRARDMTTFAIEDNIIRGNRTVSVTNQSTGAGVYLTAEDQAEGSFSGNTIVDNQATGEGGVSGPGAAIWLSDESQVVAERNFWFRNLDLVTLGPDSLSFISSQSSTLIMRDSVVAGSNGSGIVASARDEESTIHLSNFTIADNDGRSIRFFGSGTKSLYNSIVLNDGNEFSLDEDVQTGGNLIDTDPFFADPENGDYRLSAGSPAIDAGSGAPPADLGEFDLDGDDRVFGLAVDAGAYEFNQTETVWYLTQIGNGQAGNIVLSTQIDVAALPGGGQAAFTIDFFDPAGGRWELDVNGQITAGDSLVSSVSARLDPGETWSLSTSGSGGIEAGYARIRSGEGIGVTGIFTRQDLASGTILYQAGVPASEWLNEATLFVDSVGDLETGLAIVNVVDRQEFPSQQRFPLVQAPAGRPGEMFLKLRDQEFNLLGETVLELGAGQHQASFVSQLFPDVEEASEMQGVLTVGSVDPIALVTLRQNDAPGVEFPDEVPTLAAFPVLESRAPEVVGPQPQGAIPIEFFFAQIGNGQAGTIGLQTAMNLANVSAGEVPVQLDFFESSGNPMVLRIVGLGSDSTFNFVLGSGQSTVLETTGQGGIQAGYARITSEEGLGGSAVFSRIDVPSGLLETESGVPASQPGTDFFLFVDTTGDAETGLALANPAPGPAGGGPTMLNVSLLNMAGQEIANRELALATGQHTAQFVTQLFPEVEGIDDMRGLLQISSPVPIVAVTLLQNDDPGTPFPQDVGTLTAFPVLTQAQ